ncbi:MAG: hypothetical protein DYG88_13390 [Chloroflexi bacterium CFX4]|nr:hypothetical protein [Chloroflexi bacterium CFX4]MDL1923524.1 STAS/SEC14 domain-containing protein [Chloroflexi bacterium CFX3]
MPIVQVLEENGRILRVTFTDPWSAEEMLKEFESTKHYLEEATRPIHLLADMRAAKRTTPGALRAREAPMLHHPMGGQVAVFGMNAVGRTLAETVFRLIRFRRARFFDSEAEALAYLRGLIAADQVGE